MVRTRARTIDPKVRLLRSVPGLGSLPDRDLAGLARLFDEVVVDAGRALVREGEPGRELFIIIEGQAAVSSRSRGLAVLGPGELVGEMTLLERVPRSATVTALTPLRVLVAGASSFGALLTHPDVMRTVATTLSCRLRGSQGSPRGWRQRRTPHTVVPK